MTAIIAAIGKNYEIGKENQLLCSLPADMKHFREYTANATVIMGRKTYESIGHPLPNRKNIVITRNPDYKTIGADVTDSIDSALQIARSVSKPPIVIGGAQIYKQSLPLATELCLTHIDAEFPEADSFFPKFDLNEWEEEKRIHYYADESHPYDFDIVYYKRKEAWLPSL